MTLNGEKINIECIHEVVEGYCGVIGESTKVLTRVKIRDNIGTVFTKDYDHKNNMLYKKFIKPFKNL